MNKTATPGNRRAAEGLPKATPVEAALRDILNATERAARLLEALLDIVKDDPGAQKVVEVIYLDVSASADEAARCLGVRVEW